MGKKTYDNSSVSMFPEEFKMVLPEGYRIDIEYDDNWNEVPHLRGGFYINDDGEEDFDFTCSFVALNSEVNDRKSLIREGKLKETFVPGLMLEQVAKSVMESQEEQFGPGTRYNLYNSFPASTIMKYQNPISFFGIPLDTYILFYWVEVTENLMFGLNTVFRGDYSESDQFYSHLLDVIKSVRVKGKAVEIGDLTPEKLKHALDEGYEENTTAFDLALGAGVASDGDNVDSEYKYASPDEALYPHYNSMLRAKGFEQLGATVVVNQTGMEYQFFNLKEDLSADASVEMKEAVSRLSDTGAAKYELADQAVKMRSLFHVNPEVFDPQHDRECELAEGMMHRAYMMSALRSFGWILTNYCDENGCGPGEIGCDRVYEIIEAASAAEWLNYDDSVCKGLCGTQDLHVYYLPDNTPDEVKAAFLPSQEKIDETKKIQQSLPSYNPILEQVGSLDELRNDLEYIGEAIGYIYEKLEKNRDYSQPLVGDDADLLYAWCALAYAARGPFFTEDGPMNCSFTQLTEKSSGSSNGKKIVPKNNKETESFSGAIETAIVDDTWAIEIPAGYKYCTNRSVIGEHRNIVIIKDVDGNEFEDPFNASVSFTSMYTESQKVPAPAMAKMMVGYMGGDKETVLKDEDNLYVAYYFDSSSDVDGEKLDIFKIHIGCGDGVSSIQVYFNGNDDSREAQEKLVETVAKSIRLKQPGEKSAEHDAFVKVKNEDLIPSAGASKPIVRSKRNIDMWGFKVSVVPDKRKKLIDNNKGFPIRVLPHTVLQKNWKHDMMAFQYYCSLHCSEFTRNVNSIIEHAEKYLTLFSSDGISSDLKAGKLKSSAPIHALRSFIWTAAEMQDGKVKKSFPENAPEDMWVDLAAFIRMHGYANYSSVDKKTKRFGAALLRKEEVRSVYTDACGFSNTLWSYQDASLGKTMSNASISSLFQVIEVLLQTMPVMELYYNHLEKGDNQTDIAESMKTILSGWLVFAFACGQPFFIVPGEYCADDVDLSSASNWTKALEQSETGDGKFTLWGTAIIGAKDCGKEVIIPEGVTGIIISEDTIPGLQVAFENTERIVYPHSYTGSIMVPSSVKEIDVLGDLETITKVRLSDEKASLRSLNFLGKPKSVGTNAFYGLNNLKTIVLPEGVETLYDEAFFGWQNHGELFLPESLKSLEGKVFNAYSIAEDITINVYKDCPAKKMIKEQLDDHKAFLEEQERKYPGLSNNRKYGIKLIELESPWDIRAQSFISGLDILYNEPKPSVSVEKVKGILEETIGSADDYLKCKPFILSNAKESNRSCLIGLVENSTDDQKSYGLLPEALTTDINQTISSRLKEEKKKKLQEIKTLSQSNEIADLDKAIVILEELKKDGVDADPIIEQFSKKIENIKSAKYNKAESLVVDGTVSSISEALTLLQSIDSYKDSATKIAEYENLLAKEKEYETSVSLLQKSDLESLNKTRERFDKLGGYKDAEAKSQECSDKIESIITKENENAQILLDSADDGSLGKALGIYKRLASFDKDESRTQTYAKRIAAINKIYEHKDTIKSLKAEHANLGGVFKKKERLAVENRIDSTEKAIVDIRNGFISDHQEEPLSDQFEATPLTEGTVGNKIASDISQAELPAKKKSKVGLVVIIGIIVVALVIAGLVMSGMLGSFGSSDQTEDLIEEDGEVQEITPAFTAADKLTFEEMDRKVYNYDDDSYLEVYYKVTNNSDETIWNLSFDTIYYDSSGKAINKSWAGYTGSLDPGKYAYVTDSPDFEGKDLESVDEVEVHSYTYSVGNQSYELNLKTNGLEAWDGAQESEKNTDYKKADILSFELTDGKIKKDEFGDFIIKTKVTNNGTTPVYDITARMEFYDSDGNSVYQNSSGFEDILQPGESKVFDMYVEEHQDEIDSVDFISYDYKYRQKDESGFSSYSLNKVIECAYGYEE